MGNDANNIERIAPTPWSGTGSREIEDASGSPVAHCYGEKPLVTLRRDRIIACVNFCALSGLQTRELETAIEVTARAKENPNDKHARAVARGYCAQLLAALRNELRDA